METSNVVAVVKFAAYDSHGEVLHREKRLQGLKEQLHRAGFEVKLEQEPDIRNLVEVYVYGLVAFTCDITQLDYLGDGELDPLCHEIVDAALRVKNATGT